MDIIHASDLMALKQKAILAINNQVSLSNLNKVISAIMRQPDARMARMTRGNRERRVCIAHGNTVALPSLDHLSSGQSGLLSIFGTVLKYGDAQALSTTSKTIEGIVLIDEIDAHLHADLQHDVLPELLALFPRVQFIVSSHAPLFPLGMEKRFGAEGFDLLELPSGRKISAERFSEFSTSMGIFGQTKAFEEEIANRVQAGPKPLVLCEGETDPAYIRAAAAALGLGELTETFDIDWVGQKTSDGADGGGKDALGKAFQFLKNNPNLASNDIVLLFDSDTNRNSEDHGRIHVRAFPFNKANTVCPSGIENLLPNEVFEDQWYETSERHSGTDLIIRKALRKKDLCDFLCSGKPKRNIFANFEDTLSELMSLSPKEKNALT